MLCLALAKVNWFSTSTPSLSFFFLVWLRVRVRIRVWLWLWLWLPGTACLLVVASSVPLLPELFHVLTLWTAVDTHTHTYVFRQLLALQFASPFLSEPFCVFLCFFEQSCTYYRHCLFVNKSVFLKSPTHYVLYSTCCMWHAINARAVVARKLATPATGNAAIAVNKVKSIVTLIYPAI